MYQGDFSNLFWLMEMDKYMLLYIPWLEQPGRQQWGRWHGNAAWCCTRAGLKQLPPPSLFILWATGVWIFLNLLNNFQNKHWSIVSLLLLLDVQTRHFFINIPYNVIVYFIICLFLNYLFVDGNEVKRRFRDATRIRLWYFTKIGKKN